MKTTEFTMPEITISYKDNVKASERTKKGLQKPLVCKTVIAFFCQDDMV